MRIQKINENKLEVLITEQDLEGRNIKLQDFMACQIQSQNFFTNILDFANKKLGFKYNNCKILVESFSIPSLKSFIITIATVPRKIHIDKNTKLKIHCYFVAKFYSFQNLCSFCNAIDINSEASLYYLYNTYYLNLKINHINKYRKIILILKEFADDFKIQGFINENSNLIIKNNAIQICKEFI